PLGCDHGSYRGFSFRECLACGGRSVRCRAPNRIGPPGRRPLGGHSDSIATVVHVGSSCTCSRPLRLPISGGMATGGGFCATSRAVGLGIIFNPGGPPARTHPSREHSPTPPPHPPPHTSRERQW